MTAKPRAGIARFIVVLALVLGAGMVGQLALATALDSQAFVMNAKRQDATRLAHQLSDLEVQAAKAGSLTSLAHRATRLGMKPNPHPAQLRLPDGRLLGKPKVVVGDEVPGDGYKTPKQFAAQRAAADAAAKASPSPSPSPAERTQPAEPDVPETT